MSVDVVASEADAHSCPDCHRRLGERRAKRNPSVSESVLRVPLQRRVDLFCNECVCFCYKMAFNGEGPHSKRQRTDTDPASNRVSIHVKSSLETRPCTITGGASHPELFSLIKSRRREVQSSHPSVGFLNVVVGFFY